MALNEEQLRALEALESMDDFARMDTGVEPIGPYKVLREFIEAPIAQPASEQKPVPTWIVVQRQGFSAVRKGPLVDSKHTEQMLRELYELHPDCICTVIEFDHAEYPEDGREWISIYGDGRRKKPAPSPDFKAQRDALMEVAKLFKTHQEFFDAGDDVTAMVKYAEFVQALDAAVASVKGGA